jgi:hypothetical protein
LLDYETVLKFIRTTKTSTGLKIRAFLNSKHYHKGIKVSDQQMQQIVLKRYTQRPKWNYSIAPSKMRIYFFASPKSIQKLGILWEKHPKSSS